MHIDGPVGPLEARYDAPHAPRGRHAVLCHPHPRYGGSLDDAVLDALAGVLLAAGCGVLRFNFRGVGGSAGRYDGGAGETADLLAAAAWLRQRESTAELWAGGYSFGAWVTWHALDSGLDPRRVILVAPPVGAMTFPALDAAVPVDVVVGSADEFVDPTALAAWPDVTVHRIEGADHFFSGRHADLRETLRSLLPGRRPWCAVTK